MSHVGSAAAEAEGAAANIGAPAGITVGRLRLSGDWARAMDPVTSVSASVPRRAAVRRTCISVSDSK